MTLHIDHRKVLKKNISHEDRQTDRQTGSLQLPQLRLSFTNWEYTLMLLIVFTYSAKSNRARAGVLFIFHRSILSEREGRKVNGWQTYRTTLRQNTEQPYAEIPNNLMPKYRTTLRGVFGKINGLETLSPKKIMRDFQRLLYTSQQQQQSCQQSAHPPAQPRTVVEGKTIAPPRAHSMVITVHGWHDRFYLFSFFWSVEGQ